MSDRQREPPEPAVGEPAAPLGGRLQRADVWLQGALVFLLVLAAACASWAGASRRVELTPEELLRGTALGVAAGRPAAITPEASILAITPEMRVFIAAHVSRGGSAALKLHQLVTAIMDPHTFGVTYDETTRTASDTFRTRKGNCLSFSNMFVAMARDVGLNAEFQEVDVPPDWTVDKDTFVLNQHVDVFVNLGADGTRVVDFNIADFKASYEMRTISDTMAAAHFYNNMGVERMLAGDRAAAVACFRAAIDDGGSGFSSAWTNLGTLYLRNGHPAHAEAAYLQALEVNDSDLVAMSDLARLYEREGDLQRAAAYRKRVARHRWLNPYYRAELARRAYEARRYDEAIPNVRFATGERPKEDRFWHLLGLCYVGEGKLAAARRALSKAEEVAATDAQKQAYASELARLLGAAAPPLPARPK
jgi:tetratricopeptide (TPR) repeat protein